MIHRACFFFFYQIIFCIFNDKIISQSFVTVFFSKFTAIIMWEGQASSAGTRRYIHIWGGVEEGCDSCSSHGLSVHLARPMLSLRLCALLFYSFKYLVSLLIILTISWSTEQCSVQHSICTLQRTVEVRQRTQAYYSRPPYRQLIRVARTTPPNLSCSSKRVTLILLPLFHMRRDESPLETLQQPF